MLTENLKRLRCEKGLTQEQVAHRLGVSPQSVSRWECAATLPDVMLLPELARLYGVTVDDLYRHHPFACYDRALTLDGTLRDAKFSKAAGYEDLGDYKKARDLWREIIAELRQAGYEAELAYPIAREEACGEKLHEQAVPVRQQ